jgi:SAM-dependent methyltransferase
MITHPAKYSAPIMDLLAELLADADRFPGAILDPFAGTGRIHELGRDDTFGLEIEPEWADMHPRTSVGDATDTGITAGYGTICTSPAYGNRMADQYAGDPSNSRRHTYRIALGRDLTEGNGGALQWGDAYQRLHRLAWMEAHRVLLPGGRLILNISDHIRAGKRVYVTAWHMEALGHLGFAREDYHRVETARQRHGANSDARVDHEAVVIFRKAAA